MCLCIIFNVLTFQAHHHSLPQGGKRIWKENISNRSLHLSSSSRSIFKLQSSHTNLAFSKFLRESENHFVKVKKLQTKKGIKSHKRPCGTHNIKAI